MRASYLILWLSLPWFTSCQSSSTTTREAPTAGSSAEDDLQGEWLAEVYERNGKPVDARALKQTRLVFKADTIRLIEGPDGGEDAQFTLDPGEEPPQLDIHILKMKDRGKVAQGIYLLEGDVLRISWNAPGLPRPRSFTTREPPALVNLRLRRAD